MYRWIRDEWTAKLRSGEFKQGRFALRTKDDEYCCLGILCQIAVGYGAIDAPRPHPHSKNYRYGLRSSQGETQGDVAFLPIEVMEWAGIDTPDGRYGEIGYLSTDNDNGVPFDVIANIVEREF